MTRQSVTQTQQQTLTIHPLSSGILQRKCASCGQYAIAGGECAECQKKRSPLQRRARSQAEHSEVPPIVHEVLRSPGQPLDQETLPRMEPRFHHDFSSVRIHADTHAAASAQAIHAQAYTVGQDIVFGAGQYRPGTTAGQYLLAHELAHVVQQQDRGVSVGSSAGLTINAPGERLEREADDIARAITCDDSGAVAVQGRAGSPAVQRMPITPWTAAFDSIFDVVVASNLVVASSIIAIPGDWHSKVRDFATSNLLDGSILLSALGDYPDFFRGGWIMDVQPNANAMTLGRTIFVTGNLSLKTFVHELVHVAQYASLGKVAFLSSYFALSAATIAKRFIMREPINAMHSSPHEVQAYELASRFDTWHNSTYGSSATTITV